MITPAERDRIVEAAIAAISAANASSRMVAYPSSIAEREAARQADNDAFDAFLAAVSDVTADVTDRAKVSS